MRKDDLEDLLRGELVREVAEQESQLEGMEAQIIDELENRVPRWGIIGRLKNLLAPTRGTRLAQLAVLGTTAVIFLVVGMFIAGGLPGASEQPTQGVSGLIGAGKETGNEILFIMPAPKADSVAIVGDFNNWETTLLSDDNEDGIWTTTLSLPPGRYEYAFIVDGRWWGQDPLADEYVHSFGEYNSVRYVERVGEGA